MKHLVFHRLAEAARRDEPVALGLITETIGFSPQKIGAMALFHADRRIEGTLGGSCLEAEVQRLALGALKTGQPARFDLVLESWIHRPFQFLGMVGSVRKARTISEHFIRQKLATPEEMARVACPVGIRICSRSVMEIAVDILAQYIDKRGELRNECRAAAVRSPEAVQPG
jgi:xanthine/CO dehydrogenase XdhC/CoxF family maturation factor